MREKGANQQASEQFYNGEIYTGSKFHFQEHRDEDREEERESDGLFKVSFIYKKIPRSQEFS